MENGQIYKINARLCADRTKFYLEHGNGMSRIFGFVSVLNTEKRTHIACAVCVCSFSLAGAVCALEIMRFWCGKEKSS